MAVELQATKSQEKLVAQVNRVEVKLKEAVEELADIEEHLKVTESILIPKQTKKICFLCPLTKCLGDNHKSTNASSEPD